MKSTWKLWASCCALAVALACGPETVRTPPAEIEGRWTTTDDPRYADRAFEITDRLLYLLLGGDTFAVHRINSVELRHDDLPLYSLQYRGDENELYSFRFYLSQEDGGTLIFPNQLNMKWHRTPNAPVPWIIGEDPGREPPPE